MWRLEARPRYDRSHLRYPRDLADGEWALIGPLVRPPIDPGWTLIVDNISSSERAEGGGPDVGTVSD
jgi:hypothetical protein